MHETFSGGRIHELIFSGIVSQREMLDQITVDEET